MVLGGPPPVDATGGEGAIDRKLMPDADAMSLACRMNSARSGFAGIAARSVRSVASCWGRVATQLLELTNRVLELLVLLLDVRDLTARVVELARRRREQEEVPQEHEDEPTGDDGDQRVPLHGVFFWNVSSRSERAALVMFAVEEKVTKSRPLAGPRSRHHGWRFGTHRFVNDGICVPIR